jgi:hypothetical protein
VLPWFGAPVWRIADLRTMRTESACIADLLRKMAVRLWGFNELRIWQSTARAASTASTAPSASVFLATADDIRDAAAQWSLALRQIAMIEPKMGADLKKGCGGAGARAVYLSKRTRREPVERGPLMALCAQSIANSFKTFHLTHRQLLPFLVKTLCK